MAARPFPILVRHFFGRFFDTESLSPQADAAANLGPLLAMLAVPSAFLAILLQSVTLVRWDLIYFRYFFLSFSMIAMAFIVVFKWDTLFPDLRDYQILTPLPLRSSTLFLAKMTALALFLGLFLADFNFFGVLLWPGRDRGRGTFSSFAAHAGAMLAGGLFAALAAATIQGVLMTFLSGRVFRRVSASIQTVLMTLLIMALFVTPLLAMQVYQLVRAKSAILYWFPPSGS